MATEFVNQTNGGVDTEDIGFVRFSTRNGPCFEFGTMTNFEGIVARVRNGERFTPLDGRTTANDPEMTPAGIEQMVIDGRATFGQFPVTVAVGSGDMFRFTVEE